MPQKKINRSTRKIITEIFTAVESHLRPSCPSDEGAWTLCSQFGVSEPISLRLDDLTFRGRYVDARVQGKGMKYPSRKVQSSGRHHHLPESPGDYAQLVTPAIQSPRIRR